MPHVTLLKIILKNDFVRKTKAYSLALKIQLFSNNPNRNKNPMVFSSKKLP